jgi:hypothetical protein
MAAANMEVLPVRWETVWWLNPSKPTTLRIPATKARIQVQHQNHPGNLEIIVCVLLVKGFSALQRKITKFFANCNATARCRKFLAC